MQFSNKFNCTRYVIVYSVSLYVRVGLSFLFLNPAHRLFRYSDFYREQLVQHTKPQKFLPYFLFFFYARCKFNKQKMDANEEVRTRFIVSLITFCFRGCCDFIRNAAKRESYFLERTFFVVS